MPKLVRVLEVGILDRSFLLTGVHLCVSLTCSNRTVFVGEQNLFELAHFSS